MQRFQKYFSLLFFIAFSFGASAWGGFVTSIYKEPWYSTLTKPEFNPPDYVFPSIWIFLYVSMAFAVWLIWINQKKTEKNTNLNAVMSNSFGFGGTNATLIFEKI